MDIDITDIDIADIDMADIDIADIDIADIDIFHYFLCTPSFTTHLLFVEYLKANARAELALGVPCRLFRSSSTDLGKKALKYSLLNKFYSTGCWVQGFVYIF